MTNVAATVLHRIYADFVMPSRLPAYRRLLAAFLAAGYEVVSIETWWNRRRSATPDPAARTVILRHDIDTDAGTGRRMWEIESGLGIQASFFFRLSTLDVSLMQAIDSAGGHASYHYEELATCAKRWHLRTRQEVDDRIGDIREEFRRNLESLRGRTGLALDIVASHGDFANRRLGVPNWFLLSDPAFRRDVGIELETYDDAMMQAVTSRHSDTLHPRYWVAEDPLAAVRRGEPVIYLLVHPRHWRVARRLNALDDLRRLRDSLAYGR